MRKLLLIGLLILCYTDGITQKITLSEKEELNMRDDDFMVIGNVRNLTSVYRNHQAIGEVVFYTKNLIKEKISTLAFLPASILKIYFTATTEALSVFYVVKENSASLMPLAMNFNNAESNVEILTSDELLKLCQQIGLIDFSVKDADAEMLQSLATELGGGISLWKYLIYAALLFIALEIIFIKLWKSKI